MLQDPAYSMMLDASRIRTKFMKGSLVLGTAGNLATNTLGSIIPIRIL